MPKQKTKKAVDLGRRAFEILKEQVTKRKLTPSEMVGNSNYAIDETSGLIRNVKHLEFVDKLMEARRKKKPWDVIDMIVKEWAQLAPKQFEAFKVHLDNTRKDLKNKKFASTPDLNAERRMVMIFPQQLHDMIRSVYKADELLIDKEFYQDFCKLYPFFQIPEKL